MIVEDEVIVARTIANQLKQLGYTVVATAASGARAIDQALATQPDLVLMDIMLKGDMDGITAASEIRQHLDVPVVYLTAYADDATLSRAKLTQPFGYMVKPFDERELRVTLEVALYRHQLERSVRNEREQLATLLRSMSDGVIATDLQGLISYMNPAAESLTGWQQAEAAGRSISEVLQLVDEVTGEQTANPVIEALQQGQVVYLGDYQALVARNGQRIPIGDSASPILGEGQEVRGGVMVFWDNSQRRQTELLERALQKEKELNNLRSQFISSASHEFRNPLSVVLIATELLGRMRESSSPDQQQRYLDRIRMAVRRMNDLMEDVLLVGRADAGKLAFNPAPLDLHQFYQELIEELAIEESGLYQLQFTCEGDCSAAAMDERLLHYIFSNLLSNAVKYSPQGGTIQFRLVCHPQTNQVVFTVQDQGIGIPPADQSAVFESFHRAANVHAIPGTGLGLAIVKRCVDLHQGQIALTSEVGQGTTFTVTLPLR